MGTYTVHGVFVGEAAETALAAVKEVQGVVVDVEAHQVATCSLAQFC